MVIHVGVQDLEPAADRRERRVTQARDPDDIASAGVKPAMEGQNPGLAMHVKDPNERATQGRLPPTRSNYVRGTAQIGPPWGGALTYAVPVNEIGALGIIAPWFVLKKLLAH